MENNLAAEVVPTEKKLSPAQRELRSYMTDMLIMLAAPAVMALTHYGWRAAGLLAVSILAAVVCERAGSLLMHRENTLGDWSAVFTGAVIALMLPASAPFWLPVAGSVFAICVAKLPFGGVQKASFVPAAAGMAFLILCWPQQVFSYPEPVTLMQVAAAGSPDFTEGVSLAAMLRSGASLSPNLLNFFRVLSGFVAGPMGSTSMLVLFGTALYLLIRRPSLWIAPAGFVAVCALAAIVFPRVLSGRKASLIMEIASGMLVFSALFLLTDPATCPKHPVSRLCYGMSAGLLCMLMRYFGSFEDGSVFAVLLLNAAWPLVDGPLSKKLNHPADRPASSGQPVRKEAASS